ncbi:MAG: glycoside hydrolase family 9 protein [Calothrix sp. MO_167.B12]|nr:glycoside hydrolase family 9 protein [Calothrix sp. MO_167.B12]
MNQVKNLLAARIFLGLSIVFIVTNFGVNAQNFSLSQQIIIDQFGWRSQAVKVAIFANPVKGQNSQVSYLPGGKFEIRREDNDATVYTGSVVPWKNEKIDTSSGDQIWWGDFSNFKTQGAYYIYDPVNKVRSYSFEIRDDIYNPVMKAAVRAFYYQRCGTEIPTKYGGKWTHAACHIGVHQDLAAQSYMKKTPPKDVHGGWHDAGDMNKYVSFTAKTLWNLINAYEINPGIFPDNYNIPESGNGVPDILDEIKWELDWILRMQMADGSVANRVSSHQCGEVIPDNDKKRRYYTEPTTWATASLVIGSANASRLFKQFENVYPSYANQLITASEKAWEYLEQNSHKTPKDGHDYGDKGKLSCAAQGDEEGNDQMYRLWAAAELYRTTGKTIYKEYFESHYTPLKDGWFDPMGGKEHPWSQQLAYVTYSKTKGADRAKVTEIKNAIKTTTTWFNNLDINKDDPYRAFIWDYYWGSNQVKANWGMTFLFARLLEVDESRNQFYEQNAEEYLHYIHGRNPLSWVYLTNMGEKGANVGAENSVMEIYHSWFHNGSIYDGTNSKYGSAPGLLSGGPNKYYSVKQVSPPFGEPSQKAYKDWNSAWNFWRRFSEDSWTITEPAIYYQATYINLLAYFCKPNPIKFTIISQSTKLN